MKVKHKIWFEAHGLTIFGPGRNIFFKQIDECRSLNSAAKKLKVSYRLAWGKIKVAEERLGIRLVNVNPGENKMHLTENARKLLSIFDDLEKEIAPILQNTENKILALGINPKEKILPGKEAVDQRNLRGNRSILEIGMQKKYTAKNAQKEEPARSY